MVEEDIKEYAAKKGIDIAEFAILSGISLAMILVIFGGNILYFIQHIAVLA